MTAPRNSTCMFSVAAVLALGTSAPVQAQTSGADRVVETLRAANVARGENAREAEAWRDEHARLQLLAETLREEAKRLEARAVELRAEIDRIEAKRDAEGPRGQRLAALEALAHAQAERIHASLDALAEEILPGAIPERKDTDKAGDLPAARARLDGAERGAEQVSVELVSGDRSGEALRVELLRVGGVAGWWCSLDNIDAGIARVKQGRLQLTPPTVATDKESILTACRIAKGRAAPKLVNLPMPAFPAEGAR